MIQFDLTLLDNDSAPKIADPIISTQANAEAERIHAILKHRFSHSRCSKHPGYLNLVNVIATDNGNVTAQAVRFCCSEFQRVFA